VQVKLGSHFSGQKVRLMGQEIRYINLLKVCVRFCHSIWEFCVSLYNEILKNLSRFELGEKAKNCSLLKAAFRLSLVMCIYVHVCVCTWLQTFPKVRCQHYTRAVTNTQKIMGQSFLMILIVVPPCILISTNYFLQRMHCLLKLKILQFVFMCFP
jgi:hypothetical protein